MKNLVVVLVLVCVVILSGCNGSRVIEKGIILNGQGTVKAVPDIADFNVTVVTTDPNNNSTNAIRSNARKCELLSAAMLKSGVNEKDIATIDFQASSGRKDSGYPRYQPVGKPYFKVRNTIRITVRNIKDIGKCIDAAIAAGAIDVGSVDFRFSDPAKLRAEALANAVRNAKVRAQAAAKAGGVKLLTVSRVEEAYSEYGDYRNVVVQSKQARNYAAMPSAPKSFVQPGEEKVIVEVKVTFAIKRG